MMVGVEKEEREERREERGQPAADG